MVCTICVCVWSVAELVISNAIQISKHYSRVTIVNFEVLLSQTVYGMYEASNVGVMKIFRLAEWVKLMILWFTHLWSRPLIKCYRCPTQPYHSSRSKLDIFIQMNEMSNKTVSRLTGQRALHYLNFNITVTIKPSMIEASTIEWLVPFLTARRGWETENMTAALCRDGSRKNLYPRGA